MVVLETLRIAPGEVRFTQDSISEIFGDRGQSLEAETIEGTFRKLLYGDISVSSIRIISAVRKDNRIWVVSGNRRLYVFQKLQEYGRIREISVNVVPINKPRFEEMFTTKNEGSSIYIRQNRKRRRGDKLEDRLRTIYHKWIEHGRPTDGYPSVMIYRGSSNVSSSSGVSTWSSPATPPAPSRPRVSYVEPSRTVTPPRSPPAPEKKDDSWCTIL